MSWLSDFAGFLGGGDEGKGTLGLIGAGVNVASNIFASRAQDDAVKRQQKNEMLALKQKQDFELEKLRLQYELQSKLGGGGGGGGGSNPVPGLLAQLYASAADNAISGAGNNIAALNIAARGLSAYGGRG